MSDRSASTPQDKPRRRADAERSVARITDAAVDALASDPEASMAEIARRAGVVRATVYVHFPTREALIEAVTERAIAEASSAMDAAEPQRGNPADALRRVLTSAWRTLGRYHALVAINTQLSQAELRARHHAVMARLEPLIERGQRSGTFRPDVPRPGTSRCCWRSAELRADRISANDAERALLATILGAVSDGSP